MLPADRLGDLVRQAGCAIGAIDVSMWLIDYGQVLLVPVDGDSEPTALEVANTTAGRAFARAGPIESDEPDPHRWVPLVDGTERLGVLRYAFGGPLTDTNRRDADAVAALTAALLVSKREHTDHYALRRRRQELNLAAEMQWQQLPPLESSIPSAEVAGFVEPAYGVGGDGFDYSSRGDVLDLVIYDAVGHGLHSALLSTLTIAALRHARRCRLGLAERLRAADDAIALDFGGDFVTAQVAQLVDVDWHLDLGERRPPTSGPRPRRPCGRRARVRAAPANRAPASAGDAHHRRDRALATQGSRALLHGRTRRRGATRRITVRIRTARRPAAARRRRRAGMRRDDPPPRPQRPRTRRLRAA